MRMKVVVAAMMAVILFSAAGGVVRAQANDLDVTLSFTNLAPLSGEHYEGWLIVNGAPVSTGKFQVSADGELQDLQGNAKSTFRVSTVDLAQTTTFVLSIEPAVDPDPGPAAVKPLAGDLNTAKDRAVLTPNLGVSLGAISGKYILATPSDDEGNNELSGVWFLDLSGGSPAQGLQLPDLTGTDWVYEGWSVIGGTPVTTGRFLSPAGADQDAPYSGSLGTPPFPGEDFLVNAPSGLTFPTDLSGTKAVISIEPTVDSDPGPFQFKPLVGDVPPSALDHATYDMMDASSSLAAGSVTIAEIVPAAVDYTLLIVLVGALVVAGAVVAVWWSRAKMRGKDEGT